MACRGLSPFVGGYKLIWPQIFLLWSAMIAVWLVLLTTVKKGRLFTQDTENSWPAGTPCQPSSHQAQFLLLAGILSGIVTPPLGCAVVWSFDVSRRPVLEARSKLVATGEVMGPLRGEAEWEFWRSETGSQKVWDISPLAVWLPAQEAINFVLPHIQLWGTALTQV